MPKNCDFSETQFSFCFTFEYLHLNYRTAILPIFPNTVMEGRAGGGFDVQIGGSLFFQFKIPEYFGTGRGSAQGWEHFKSPFYRIKINTNSEQFRLLHVLRYRKPANKVFYVTPEFHEDGHLETYYNSNEIGSHSAWFAIEHFPVVGSGYHHLAYTEHSPHGMLFSEPKEIPKSNAESVFSITPDYMLLSKKAAFLREVIQESTNIKVDEGIDKVFSVLLTRFNILWIPILAEERGIPSTKVFSIK